MKEKYVSLYMDIAKRISEMSCARRLKVGSVIVRENTILSYGWNGMPNGWDNECEERIYNTQYKELEPGKWINISTYKIVDINEYYPFVDDENKRYQLKTKPEVIHAEMNAIAKVAKSTETSEGATMFCTHSPCIECAKAIYQSGIKRVYYRDQYRNDSGVQLLKKGGVDVLNSG